MRGRLPDEDWHGHLQAAIYRQADFIFTCPRKLEIVNADDDGRAGRGGPGRDLNIDLLGRWGGLNWFAVRVNDRKPDFFDSFLDFAKTQFGDQTATDGDRKLRNEDDVRGSEDIQFTVGTGPGGKA